jgi:hypothetical protein
MLSCDCSVARRTGVLYRFPTLGQAPYQSRELSSGEINSFLFRHLTVYAKIEEFTAFVAVTGYSQDSSTWLNWFQSNMPGFIPGYGMEVDDAQLGQVFIFPDASGTLHYTVSTAPVGDINNPLPAAQPFAGNWYDGLVTLAEVAVLGYVGYLWLKKRK